MNKQLILLAAVMVIACNLSAQQNYQWRYSDGGTNSWQNLKSDAAAPADLRFTDFNGDGKTDVFTSANGQWKYASGGTGAWVNLASDPATPLANIAFGDFNGDGTTDIFQVNSSGQWQYSSGGTMSYTTLRTDNTAFASLRFGDFNGDGKTDVFTAANGQWKYAPSSTDAWVNLAMDPGVTLANLRFGDFNGDGKTDVFTSVNGQWKYSAGGIGSWQNLAYDNSVPLADLRFGNFNTDNKTDVFTSVNGQWRYSGGGLGSWTPLAVDPTVPLAELGFGDFNGDGKTDVFHATSGGSTPPTTGTGAAVSMAFENAGVKPVEIWSANESGPIAKVQDIGNHGRVTMPVKLGDQYVVKIDGSFNYHPKIVVSDLNASGVVIHGNEPLKAQGLVWSLPDYYPNQIGVDLKVLNPRDLVNTINKGRIFELLNPVGGVDYEVIGNKVLKYGFLFNLMNIHKGDNTVRMASDFSSFSKDWSLNVGGSASIKGVDASLNVGYNSFETEEKSSESTYAYTREQKSVFKVSIDPAKARLEVGFKLDALAIQTPAQAQAFIQKYGTHYPKVVIYGGDRSVYMVMTKSNYSKLKGFGVDVKAEVSKSKSNLENTTSKFDGNGGLTGSEDKYGSKKVGSGSLGFSYNQSQEVRNALEQNTSKYRQIGGTGGFSSWDVSELTAAPVSVELGSLAELIDIKAFKDGSDPARLAQIRQLLQQAIDQYLGDMAKYANPAPPAPRVYTVTLKTLKVDNVGEDAHDACGAMKGAISIHYSRTDMVDNDPKYGSYNKTPFYQQADWNSDLWFGSDKSYPFGEIKSTITQYPEPNGTFGPLNFQIHANFWEDDCAANPDDNLLGNTAWIPIVQGITSEGMAKDYTFQAVSSEQKLGISFQVVREISDFFVGN